MMMKSKGTSTPAAALPEIVRFFWLARSLTGVIPESIWEVSATRGVPPFGGA